MGVKRGDTVGKMRHTMGKMRHREKNEMILGELLYARNKFSRVTT